jgi:hypothetical protein
MSFTIDDLHIERDTWAARVSFDGTAARVSSDVKSSDHDEAAARAKFDYVAKVVDERLPAIVQLATKTLLKTYNHNWREPPAKELSARQFADRLGIAWIRFYAYVDEEMKGSITVALSCGDLFCGHDIECGLEWDGSPMGEPSLMG